MTSSAAMRCSPARRSPPRSPAAQPGPPPLTGVTYIHAGRLLDRPGRPPRGPSTIIVAGGRIVDGRATASTPPPAGAALIDLCDRFVLPGLIDSHVHLESDAGGNRRSDRGGDRATRRQRRFERSRNARKTLEAGFTTVRNLGDGSGATLAHPRRRRARRGRRARASSTPAARSRPPSGHMDATLGLAEDLHAAHPARTICATAPRAAAAPCACRSAAAPTSSRSPPPAASTAASAPASAARCSTTRSRPWSTPPTSTARRSRSTPTAPTGSTPRSPPAPIRSSTAPCSTTRASRLFKADAAPITCRPCRP